MNTRTTKIIISIALVASLGVGTSVNAKTPTIKYKKCSSLLKKYKYGVAKSSKIKKSFSSKATVSATIFKQNSLLDKNSNGIACDSGDLELSWSPVSYSGVGPSVLTVAIPVGGVAVIEATHSGDSNFSVSSLNAKLEQVDLIINEIGSISGTYFLSRGYSFMPENISSLEIDADGPWTFNVKPASMSTPFTGSATGSGSQVFRYGGPTIKLAASHDGDSNFLVQTYDSKGFLSDVVVNEIGRVSGTFILKTASYIVVEGDGNWSLLKS